MSPGASAEGSAPVSQGLVTQAVPPQHCCLTPGPGSPPARLHVLGYRTPHHPFQVLPRPPSCGPVGQAGRRIDLGLPESRSLRGSWEQLAATFGSWGLGTGARCLCTRGLKPQRQGPQGEPAGGWSVGDAALAPQSPLQSLTGPTRRAGRGGHACTSVGLPELNSRQGSRLRLWSACVCLNVPAGWLRPRTCAWASAWCHCRQAAGQEGWGPVGAAVGVRACAPARAGHVSP